MAKKVTILHACFNREACDMLRNSKKSGDKTLPVYSYVINLNLDESLFK